MVCSSCAEKAEAVEDDALEIELDSGGKSTQQQSDGDERNISACSWCGLDEEDLEDPITPLADHGLNELYLCDACPRAMCTRCVALSRGGSKQDLFAARKDANAVEEEWVCCNCGPTSFLKELQRSYKKIAPENVDEEKKEEEEEKESDDAYIAKLIDKLNATEDELEKAQQILEDDNLEKQRELIKNEVQKQMETTGNDLTEIDDQVEDELECYRQQWDDHHARLSDTISHLQDELAAMDVDLTALYRIRQEQIGSYSNEEVDSPDWKAAADAILEERDREEGFSKGEFRGASGYKTRNSHVYKLEPEDLDDSDLNEIEDINSLAGAISQMRANSDAHKKCFNNWGSKTGTTDDDIEMFEKKSMKFESLSLGDRIDFEKLEKKHIREVDDATVEKKTASGLRDENIRIFKRESCLRSMKLEAKTQMERSRGGNREYQPRFPCIECAATIGDVKPKKRAHLVQVVDRMTGVFTDDIPCGKVIGLTGATFESSDITLAVENCRDKISICKPLVHSLKVHQVDGVKFCWKNICSNIMLTKNESEEVVHGCILAHNMGLGKSFQVICLLHTLLTHPLLVRSNNRIVQRALLIAPVNTLANWGCEFEKWIGSNALPSVRFYCWDRQDKGLTVAEWLQQGGVLCCSFDRYANACKHFIDIGQKGSTKIDTILYKALFKPGPDIVVLDEAHSMLKSNTTNIFKTLNKQTARLRLALTGTPLQNNLSEYFNMASWVRPGCLGTEAQFFQKYERPIMDGMAADCTPSQAQMQEQLSNELHTILSPFVHRCGTEVLAKDLLPFQEVVIHVRQSKMQVKLYREFQKFKKEWNIPFFKQYHSLRPVNNHPACLLFRGENGDAPLKTNDLNHPEILPDYKPQVAPENYAWICDICGVARFKTLDEAVDHENKCEGLLKSDNDVVDDSDKKKDEMSPATPTEAWYESFARKAQRSEVDVKSIANGGKIVLLLQILAHCDVIGDKVVVFSQCLRTLNYIEEILQSPDWGGFVPYLNNSNGETIGGWKKNFEYLRIDGSVQSRERGELISAFNNTDIQQCKLFLLSTKAGSLGINLVAANRVVLFDSHWNPAVDLQAVHRCYRYGQTKPTFCYRLIAEGSMEEKIYSRAITKTSLSNLVVDQRNIDRFFTRQEMNLLQENDTWVQCDSCFKWRMLPPDTPSEVIENLPDAWYCKDNEYDKPRSTCSAKEREARWYASYWQKRMLQQESQDEIAALPLTPSKGDEIMEKFTRRDIVLQTLLSRSEDTIQKAKSLGTMKKTNSWISKYHFPLKYSETEDSGLKSPKKGNSPMKTRTIPSDRTRSKSVSVKEETISNEETACFASSAAKESNSGAKHNARQKRKPYPINKTSNDNQTKKESKSANDGSVKENKTLLGRKSIPTKLSDLEASVGQKRKSLDDNDSTNVGLNTNGFSKQPYPKKPKEAKGRVVDLTFDSDSD